MSEDPIGFLGGVNFYSYVANNTVNWIDPYGLCKEGGRKGITSQDIIDMLLGVGTAYAGELTSGQVKTYTIGELVSWKAWGGVVLTMAGRATMFVPLPGARIVGGVMMVAGGGLTIWGIVESIKTAEDLATDIGEVINEPYKEEWEEIDRRILPTKK